ASLLQAVVAMNGRRDKADPLVTSRGKMCGHSVGGLEIRYAHCHVDRRLAADFTDLDDRDTARNQDLARDASLDESLQDETRRPPAKKRTDGLLFGRGVEIALDEKQLIAAVMHLVR